MGKKRLIKEYEERLVYQEKITNVAILGGFLSARHAYLTGQADWLEEPSPDAPPVVREILTSVCVGCVLDGILKSGITDWDACLSGEISVDEHIRRWKHAVH